MIRFWFLKFNKSGEYTYKRHNWANFTTILTKLLRYVSILT